MVLVVIETKGGLGGGGKEKIYIHNAHGLIFYICAGQIVYLGY